MSDWQPFSLCIQGLWRTSATAETPLSRTMTNLFILNLSALHGKGGKPAIATVMRIARFANLPANQTCARSSFSIVRPTETILKTLQRLPTQVMLISGLGELTVTFKDYWVVLAPNTLIRRRFISKGLDDIWFSCGHKCWHGERTNHSRSRRHLS